MSDAQRSISLGERMRLRLSAWLLLVAGFFHSVVRRYVRAEASYRLALERDPGSETARLMLGESLEGQERWKEAAAVYGELIGRDPSYENAYYHRACCLIEVGRLEEAVADCRRAIELYAGHFAAYVVLGQALGRLRRHAEAMAAFERALALKPRDRQAAALLERERAAAAVASTPPGEDG